MPVICLPDEPSLAQLRKQAKDLRRAVLSGQPDALAEVAEHVPDAPASFPLHTAQLVVARRYGFPSWARLRRHVEVIEQYSRFPARMTAGPPASLADEFLRLVTVYYTDDQPERWAEGRALLAGHPEITAGSVHAAAAAADITALRRILAADPAAARREGGPFRWQPLMYLAYSRVDPGVAQDAVLTAARLLLDAGADPNAGYLWHGLTTPFTVLTGVFGEGEQGPVRQPRHPHSLALARLLLQAGADPNDGQALYNRMFEPGNDHLELLFEFGLGAGDGGPWRRRLGNAADTPAEMLRGQLAWAITHGLTERVRLLVSHGVDLTAPFERGATATSMAATTGHPDLVDYLVAHGAPPLSLDPAEEFVTAALVADRAGLDRLLREHPGLAGQVRAARPALITWAAACGRPEAVEILAGLGFDVNAMGRTDMPSDQPWQTALHHAAGGGNLELARTLLRLGADPDIRDHRFDSPPLGWARHFGQQPLIDLLEPLTAPGPESPEE
ncbi:MAG TPA: ankyrin repeat domain-containing protein [Streptosporangiaceae bacterium]|nr:ankyrin repeat domain-containing protein [Streptosporangiaceae bacterium]